MEYTLTPLKNGLQTLFINGPDTKAASIQMWFKAGSALETREDQGMAHFLEHMFFKGTDKRPGAQIAFEVESYGGEINAFTSFDYTCYYINCANEYLEKSLEILLDMVCNPAFLESDLLPERGVVHEEYRRAIDDPKQYSFMRLQQKAFAKGRSHPILGNSKNILAFSRDKLVHFRQKHYNLANSLLVIAGNLDNCQDSLKTSIEKYHFPSGRLNQLPPFKIRSKTIIDVHVRDVELAQMYLVWQAPSFMHTDSYGQELAINCLGMGESSRLHKEIVLNSSFANHCSSSTLYAADGGVHYLSIFFPISNLEKISQTILEIFRDIKEVGFQDKEAQKIKNIYIASKLYDKETIDAYSFNLASNFIQYGKIDAEDIALEQLKKVTAKQASSALTQLLKSTHHIILQIPKKLNPAIYEKKLRSFSNDIYSLAQKHKSTLDQSSPQPPKLQIKVSQFDKKVQVVNLRSNITLIYRQNLLHPIFHFNCYLPGGLIKENNNTNGQNHILMGLLTKGYDKFHVNKLKADLEFYSASLGSFTGKNTLGVTLHGQSEHFTHLSQHFFGSLFRPNLAKRLFKHEISLAQRIVKNAKKDPAKVCFQNVSEVFFSGHPYSLNLLGSEASLAKLSHQQIIKSHQHNILEEQMTFTYCGDLPFLQIVDLLQQHLPSPSKSKLKSKSRLNGQSKINKISIPPYLPQKKHIEFDREQAHIFIGFITPKISAPENIVLKMITAQLAGQSSELFVDARDRKGLCYSTAPVHFAGIDGGYWGIYMASGHDKQEQAINAIQQIIDKIRLKGINQSEFQRIKRMLQGQAALNLQTNEDYANFYSIPVLHKLGLDFNHIQEQAIKELSLSHCNQMLRKIFEQQTSQVVVGR